MTLVFPSLWSLTKRKTDFLLLHQRLAFLGELQFISILQLFLFVSCCLSWRSEILHKHLFTDWGLFDQRGIIQLSLFLLCSHRPPSLHLFVSSSLFFLFWQKQMNKKVNKCFCKELSTWEQAAAADPGSESTNTWAHLYSQTQTSGTAVLRKPAFSLLFWHSSHLVQGSPVS